MKKQSSLADIYEINPIEYTGVELKKTDFSVRTYRRLKNSRINTAAELLEKSEAELLDIKGFPEVVKKYIDYGAVLLEQEYKYNHDIYSHLVNLDAGI